MKQEIIDGRCGQVSDKLLEGLVLARRTRDAMTADVLCAALPLDVPGLAQKGRGLR